jgi:TonB family protein
MVADDERDAFLAAFASSQAVTVVSRDQDAAEGVRFDTILEGGLQGSAQALNRLRTCTRDVGRREAAARAREDAVAHIDRDPFRSEEAGSSSQADPPRASVIRNPSWSRHPPIEFPERAAARGIRSGRVSLNCLPQPNGSLTDCRVESEDPAGAGFGLAALSGARRARLSPRDVANAAAGARVVFSLRFEAPAEAAVGEMVAQ